MNSGNIISKQSLKFIEKSDVFPSDHFSKKNHNKILVCLKLMT
jgi:hypothetical protein